MHACRIYEAVVHAVNIDAGLDRVACGAGYVGYHGSLLAGEAVQEGAFADVGAADDSHGDTLLEGVSEGERAGEGCDLVAGAAQQGVELRAVGKLYILLREVEFEFEQ